MLTKQQTFVISLIEESFINFEIFLNYLEKISNEKKLFVFLNLKLMIYNYI